MFWGGASAPARFLVPLVPCLAPLVAVAIGAATTPMARALVGLWLSVGIAISGVAAVMPERLLLYSDPHGQAKILEIVQAGAPLARRCSARRKTLFAVGDECPSRQAQSVASSIAAPRGMRHADRMAAVVAIDAQAAKISPSTAG